MSDENNKAYRRGNSLTDSGLVEIGPDQFPEKIRDVKRLAIGRLEELLQLKTGLEEQRYVAHSLGTLKRLEKAIVDGTNCPR